MCICIGKHLKLMNIWWTIAISLGHKILAVLVWGLKTKGFVSVSYRKLVISVEYVGFVLDMYVALVSSFPVLFPGSAGRWRAKEEFLQRTVM